MYKERQQAVIAGLERLGINVFSPKATFFVWAQVPGEESSAAFADRLLEQTGVVVTPGAAFGGYGEGYFRITLSQPSDRLEEAVKRMQSQLAL